MDSIPVPTECFDAGSCLGHEGPTGEVDEHHVFRLPDVEEFGDVVEVEVPTDARSTAMIRIEERAFRDDDLGLAELVSFEEVPTIRVPGVRDERNLRVEGEIHPFRTKATKFALGKFPIVLSKLPTVLDDRETETRTRVMGLDRAEHHPLTHRDLLVGRDGVDLVRSLLPLDIDPRLQHPPERIPAMVQAWRNGAEVVTAVRDDRDAEGLVKVATASWFYRVFNRLVDSIQLQEGAGDFRLLSAPVVEAVTQLREATRFSKGLMP